MALAAKVETSQSRPAFVKSHGTAGCNRSAQPAYKANDSNSSSNNRNSFNKLLGLNVLPVSGFAPGVFQA